MPRAKPFRRVADYCIILPEAQHHHPALPSSSDIGKGVDQSISPYLEFGITEIHKGAFL
jgi:hypothetical protein